LDNAYDFPPTRRKELIGSEIPFAVINFTFLSKPSNLLVMAKVKIDDISKL